MRNTFSFRFLISPSNPRQDTWIGQAFGLSYLNSQPGNSYLFRFKPYWAGESRTYDGPLFADRAEQVGGEVHNTVLGRRGTDKEAILPTTIKLAYRRRVEALFSRQFLGSLESATAIVQEVLYSQIENKEADIDLITIAQRVNEKKNTLKTGNIKSGRVQIHDDAIVLADMMLGYIRRHNSPSAIVGGYTLADQDRRLNDASIVMNIKQATTEKLGITPTMKLATEYDRTGFISRGTPVAFRPNVIHDAIESEMKFGNREDQYALIVPTVKIGEQPDKHVWISGYSNASRDINHEGTMRDEMAFALEPEKYGLMYQTINAQKNHNLESRIHGGPVFAFSEIRKDSMIDTQYVRVSLEKSTDARIDWDITKTYGSGVHQGRYDLQQISKAEYNGKNAHINDGSQLFDGPDGLPMDAWIVQELIIAEPNGQQARVNEDKAMFDYIEPLNARYDEQDMIRANTGSYDAREEREIILVDEKRRQTTWNPEVGIKMIDREGHHSRVTEPDGIVRAELGRIDAADFGHIMYTMNDVPLDARPMFEANVRVDKVQRRARIVEILTRLDLQWKASMIRKYWDLYEKLSRGAGKLRDTVAERSGEMEEHEKLALILDIDKMQKAEKDSRIEPMINAILFAERDTIDAALMTIMHAERPDNEALLNDLFNLADRTPGNSPGAIVGSATLADRPEDNREGIKYELTNAERDLSKLKGIIEEMVIGHKAEEQRPAYIPVERYFLVGDLSEWEDIWNNYSPGVDVLDVPDSDYDYSSLANRVFDPETGVPLNPIGPTNKADVKVKIPLHHPIPSNAEIGIGPTVVDNYVLMDVILAVESLKTRNKMRFAGMPVEKTMRELLAKLYAWVQQSAPGVFEYERAFRFVRWYAEATVTKLSTHILQRVYKSWMSEIHNNGDLGTKYTSTGWLYMPNASIIQTTDTTASLKFDKANYIDGEITVRGYFDNPLREGTMELKVDGVTKAQLDTTSNGVFTLNFEVPAGHHNYEIVFNGASGRISLSSLEITGCEFVSATTVADDSDANGLKACTTLMQMLLLYFERHHGGGKVKGTMAIKQRGVWNQT